MSAAFWFDSPVLLHSCIIWLLLPAHMNWPWISTDINLCIGVSYSEQNRSGGGGDNIFNPYERMYNFSSIQMYALNWCHKIFHNKTIIFPHSFIKNLSVMQTLGKRKRINLKKKIISFPKKSIESSIIIHVPAVRQSNGVNNMDKTVHNMKKKILHC